jgi:hypothetical protein
MTSPFLVDNILHQQKTVNFHNQYLNQQIENYVLQRQSYERSRENTPEVDEHKMAEPEDENRNEESIDDSKLEDDDSKSRDDEDNYNVKTEQVYYSDYYQRGEDRDKEVLNIPNLSRRCQSCGSSDCPPFTCKKSGIRRLEELEKRFNLNYQENSGDEGDRERYNTDEMVRNCEEYSSEQKKPPLKFSVSAILGDREETAKTSNVSGESTLFISFKYLQLPRWLGNNDIFIIILRINRQIHQNYFSGHYYFCLLM